IPNGMTGVSQIRGCHQRLRRIAGRSHKKSAPIHTIAGSLVRIAADPDSRYTQYQRLIKLTVASPRKSVSAISGSTNTDWVKNIGCTVSDTDASRPAQGEAARRSASNIPAAIGTAIPRLTAWATVTWVPNRSQNKA